MVRQVVDSELIEHRLTNSETDFPTCEKQILVTGRKTALRDLQNDNRIMESSSFSKDRGPIVDSIKVSGIKRSSAECPVSPMSNQSRNNNVANGHLVYVRRKSEAEIGKSSTCDTTRLNNERLHERKLGHREDTTQSRSQMEPTVSCLPACAPFPLASSMSSSVKPSVTCSLGNTVARLAPEESNYPPVASAIPLRGNPKGMKNLHWEERYKQLQILLRELDQSDQKDYLKMLRSLSSVELSRHAVELEKRSIRLSLEEAKEFQRVEVLNVLGKCKRNFTAP